MIVMAFFFIIVGGGNVFVVAIGSIVNVYFDVTVAKCCY